MEVLDRKNRVAKKEHTCDLCGFKIATGEKYDWQKNVHDGMLYEFKMHLSCLELASKLNMFEQCDDGVTGDDFIEFVAQEYPESIKGLKFRDVLNFVKEKHNINSCLNNNVQIRTK